MKIPLSESDFLLLLKRYMKDGYLVNYVAFLKHIDNITDYLKAHNLLDNSGVGKNLFGYQEHFFTFFRYSRMLFQIFLVALLIWNYHNCLLLMAVNWYNQYFQMPAIIRI